MSFKYVNRPQRKQVGFGLYSEVHVQYSGGLCVSLLSLSCLVSPSMLSSMDTGTKWILLYQPVSLLTQASILSDKLRCQHKGISSDPMWSQRTFWTRFYCCDGVLCSFSL